jgi:hypothetical protein
VDVEKGELKMLADGVPLIAGIYLSKNPSD